MLRSSGLPGKSALAESRRLLVHDGQKEKCRPAQGAFLSARFLPGACEATTALKRPINKLYLPGVTHHLGSSVILMVGNHVQEFVDAPVAGNGHVGREGKLVRCFGKPKGEGSQGALNVILA